MTKDHDLYTFWQKSCLAVAHNPQQVRPENEQLSIEWRSFCAEFDPVHSQSGAEAATWSSGNQAEV